MRWLRRLLPLLLAAGAACTSQTLAPAADPPRVILEVTDPALASSTLAAAGAERAETIAALGLWVVAVPGAPDARTAAARLAGRPGIGSAEPDARLEAPAVRSRLPVPAFALRATGDGRDPLRLFQWGLRTLQAEQAWALSRSRRTVRLAVLDTGIDVDHPDLSGKIAASVNFSAAPDALDRYGHGTHVAGIAAAWTDNGLGVAGLAPEASLLNVKVLGDDGRGQASDVAAGIVWAVAHGANVINMSLNVEQPNAALGRAVAYAQAHNVLVVANAGNDGTSRVSYPAGFPGVLAVAASTEGGSRAPFSTHGRWVDVTAPGSAILATLPRGGARASAAAGRLYGELSGTSMAAGFVSGLAALLWPELEDARAIAARLEATCLPIERGSTSASGHVNAYRALEATRSKSPRGSSASPLRPSSSGGR